MLDTNNAATVVLTRPNLKLVLRVSHESAVPLLIQNVIQFAIKMSLFIICTCIGA